MININVIDSSDLITVEIIRIKQKEDIISNDWESKLRQYSKENRKVVFKVKEPDNDGMFMRVIGYWLRYSDEAIIKTDHYAVKWCFKDVVEGKKVKFLPLANFD